MILQLFHHFKPSPSRICFKFKSLDTHDCALKSNRVDIWQFPLHHLWLELSLLLNKSEVERAAQYYFERHRRRFAIARATLRLILAQYLKEQAPQKLIFIENKYGKPSLLHYPELTFNLSHSKELALLAIGHNYPVGIDLEFFSGRSYVGIGEQLFSDQENQAFKKVTKSIQTLSFFCIWSQKEAFIKACGLGLSYPTKKFSVPHLPHVEKINILDKQHNISWHMTSFMPQVACAAAICYHPNIQEVRYLSILPKDTFEHDTV